ncbi:MAG: bile acid:sodium symporter family protein [Planctomycetaceae bacterium]|nr:bile acid:sodium symporter family protein [Planctomycetaceae bacterium]
MIARFPEYELYVTSALCVLALFGMGTTLTGHAFRGVAARPRCLVLILVSQLIVGPMIAVGLSELLYLPPGIAVGLLLVTALPGGLFSNIFTLYAKGSIALSVSATAVCTMASMVTTTIVLEAWGGHHFPDDFQMPAWQLVYDICVSLLLPLIVGMSLRRHAPNRAMKLGRWAVRTATALLVFYIVASVQTGRINLSAYAFPIHLSIVLLVTIQSYACNFLSWIFRLTVLERVTSQIEVVIRNIHLGLLLNASLFPFASEGSDHIGTGVLFVLLYYGAASIVGGFAIVGVRRFDLYRLGDRHPGPPPSELRDW